jgi:hypothetical protein
MAVAFWGCRAMWATDDGDSFSKVTVAFPDPPATASNRRRRWFFSLPPEQTPHQEEQGRNRESRDCDGRTDTRNKALVGRPCCKLPTGFDPLPRPWCRTSLPRSPPFLSHLIQPSKRQAAQVIFVSTAAILSLLLPTFLSCPYQICSPPFGSHWIECC